MVWYHCYLIRTVSTELNLQSPTTGLIHDTYTEAVVAESVVVIKKLMQTQPSAHRGILVQMACLMEKVAVPQARASILWLLGEYSESVPKIAPDVLRSVAESFVNEVRTIQCVSVYVYYRYVHV
jgi:vesicle coat complex subunit